MQFYILLAVGENWYTIAFISKSPVIHFCFGRKRMNTHVLRAASVPFVAIVLATFFFCVPQSEAQMRTLAFSATDRIRIDGFNNGNVLLPPATNIPLTIGVFNLLTGQLSPLNEPDELVVQLLDAGGNRHPGLSVTTGGLLPLDSGQSSVTSTLGLHWNGAGSTIATVVVRDTRSLLVSCSVMVVLDPFIPLNMRVTALVVYDVNNNSVYDANDKRLDNCTVVACPPGVPLVSMPDKSYVLDSPIYNNNIPLYLHNTGAPGWRQVLPAPGSGSVVDGSGSDTVVFLMQPASKTVLFSGFRHDLFGQSTVQVEDSLLVFRGFSDTSPVLVDVDASDWRMTGLLEPTATATTASLMMTVLGTGLACPDRLYGTLSVLSAGGVETITPDFSAVGSSTYTMTIYRNGEVVYTESARSGAGVLVPRAVRQWGAGKGMLTVTELLPRTIQIVGGQAVLGDQIIFEPTDHSASSGICTTVLLGGSANQVLTVYRHETNVFGIDATCTGNTLFSGVQSDDTGLSVKGGTSGALFLSSKQMRNLNLHWGTPSLPEAKSIPVVSLEGYCATEACPLGVIGLFRDADSSFSCRTLPTSYGNALRSIEVLSGGVPVTTATTTGDIAARYNQWPVGCRVTTQYGASGYILSWDSDISLMLPDGRRVMGDGLRVSFRNNEPVRELSGMMVKPANEWIIHIDDIDNDSIRALTLVATITIGGNVFNDKNGDGVWQTTLYPEPGRSGRKVFLYGEHYGEVDSVITDSAGAYTAIFDPLYTAWAPVYVSLQTAAGWQRTNLDYDMAVHGTANQSLYGINFGEQKIPGEPEAKMAKQFGIDDMFANGVSEASAPSAELRDRMSECRHAATEYFDSFEPDHWFIHTLSSFRTEKCVVRNATLTMRVRAGTASSYNDGIAIRRDGHLLWSGSIAQLTEDRIWMTGKTTLLSLDLTALPLADGSTTTILPAIQNGQLDVLLFDDTSIDYLTYDADLACENDQGNPIVTDVREPETPLQITIAPNPNTGTGTIGFDLAKNEPVTLVISDVLQREVLRLLDAAPLDAGKHSLQFSLPSLPPGTYFLQMSTGTARSTCSFVLIR